MTDMNEAITAQWENGELGTNPATVRVAKGVSDALDQATGMKLVTMRLPIPLIEALKAIAGHHGIAYQPMVRDLLVRFAESEFKAMMQDQVDTLAKLGREDSTAPVQSFIDNERIAACG